MDFLVRAGQLRLNCEDIAALYPQAGLVAERHFRRAVEDDAPPERLCLQHAANRAWSGMGILASMYYLLLRARNEAPPNAQVRRVLTAIERVVDAPLEVVEAWCSWGNLRTFVEEHFGQSSPRRSENAAPELRGRVLQGRRIQKCHRPLQAKVAVRRVRALLRTRRATPSPAIKAEKERKHRPLAALDRRLVEITPFPAMRYTP